MYCLASRAVKAMRQALMRVPAAAHNGHGALAQDYPASSQPVQLPSTPNPDRRASSQGSEDDSNKMYEDCLL